MAVNVSNFPPLSHRRLSRHRLTEVKAPDLFQLDCTGENALTDGSSQGGALVVCERSLSATISQDDRRSLKIQEVMSFTRLWVPASSMAI